MASISILGAGSWGTAVGVMLAKNGHSVRMWSHNEEKCYDLKKYRENKPYLPGVEIPQNIEFTSDISTCQNTDITIIAVPSHAMRETARKFRPYTKEGQIILNISKGLEDDTHYTISQILRDELPDCEIAVMSGPSHAEEVARGIPTTNVISAQSEECAEKIQDTIMNPSFRVYTNPDMLGVELGGALKNVIALCAGILDGLNLGDNSKAALMTRGIVEIARLGTAMGANPETFYGLSGIGDLIVTCTSIHSRNRRAGILIGQGKSCDEATAEVNMVVEGIKTCRAAKELAASLNIEMPIVNEAYKVLFEGMPPENTVSNLMNRSKKHESEFNFLYN